MFADRRPMREALASTALVRGIPLRLGHDRRNPGPPRFAPHPSGEGRLARRRHDAAAFAMERVEADTDGVTLRASTPGDALVNDDEIEIAAGTKLRHDRGSQFFSHALQEKLKTRA